MKKIAILIACFLSLFCGAETNLSGKWAVFLEKNGIICYRADYNCEIKENKTWAFKRLQDGHVTASGTLTFAEKSLFLTFPESGSDPKVRQVRKGLKITSCTQKEMRLYDPLSKVFLVFLPDREPEKPMEYFAGTWRFRQKDPASGEVRQAPFSVHLQKNGVFSVQYSGKKSPQDPEKGSYEFKNGFLRLHPSPRRPQSFWDDPVFFCCRDRLILNNPAFFVCGEKE